MGHPAGRVAGKTLMDSLLGSKASCSDVEKRFGSEEGWAASSFWLGMQRHRVNGFAYFMWQPSSSYGKFRARGGLSAAMSTVPCCDACFAWFHRGRSKSVGAWNGRFASTT